MKIYFPFADNPEVPLSLSIKRDARVEDVIGFALYEYVNVGVEPRLPVEVCDVVCWNMRIVEDDGAVDEDFPGIFYICIKLIFLFFSIGKDTED